MRKFGYIRMVRDDIRFWHKIYFLFAGVSPDHKLRFLYFNRMISNELNNLKLNAILDAGCGSGDYSYYLADKYPDSEITAIDIDENRVNKNAETAKKLNKCNIHFKCKDIARMNDTDKYNLICCVDVLEHVVDTKSALANLMNALVEGGYLYIHFPLKKERPVFFEKHLKEFHDWVEDEHVAEPLTNESFMKLIGSEKSHVVSKQASFNHYLGELCVSLIMLFYRNTLVNNIVKAILSPVMLVLIYLDISIKNKTGNAIALMIKKGGKLQPEI